MPRYKITIEHDGTGLAGWQKQKDAYGVQDALQKAVQKFAQEDVDVVAAGRTDAGVHALAQIAHFDLLKDWDAFKVREAVNFYLREDKKLPIPMQISILECEKVSADFHARFSAKKRYYIYRIVNRRSHLALDNNRAWCVFEELDTDAMQDAAEVLIGSHDFTSFRAVGCQAKSPLRTVDKIQIQRKGDDINIRVEALSFLHHQVRNFVGSLKLVGTGKWTKQDLQDALDAKDRTKAGPTAPAQGLYLVKVDY